METVDNFLDHVLQAISVARLRGETEVNFASIVKIFGQQVQFRGRFLHGAKKERFTKKYKTN